MKRIYNLLPKFIKNFIYKVIVKRKYPNTVIESNFIFNNVEIGHGSKIHHDAVLMPNVNLGKYNLINTNSYMSNVSTGNFVSVGRNCQIGAPEHPIDHLSTSPFIYDKNRSILNLDLWNENYYKTKIGHDTWIGSNVIIKQGLTIGDGSIIGAGSVVTKNIEPYSIVGGVPAKLIRKRFNKEQLTYLVQNNIWEYHINDLKKLENVFENKENWYNFKDENL